MAREVFISYRKEDKPAADRICQALEEANIKCWIAPRDVPIGREWAVSIVEAIKNCSSFVLVLSASSKNAKQIAREAELADNAGLPIITVRVEDVQPPPELQYFLGNVQWLDAFESNFDPAMRRLLEVVRQRAESPAQLRDAPAESVTREPRAQAAAAAASAQAGPGFAQGVPLSQPPKPSGVSESVPAGYPEPAPPRRVLSPYVLAGALVLLVALGIGIWWARRPAPVPAPTPVADTTGAAAFGIGYMQKRDSAQTAAAYDMTGPTFRK
ncbi:MAG: toll/interleukin-1 receptor domain-containing protein, partial [Acidobacteriaceae bacterium]|nr:toll/interleukin-1 receptor domain-containing protein [Acidobacteriaceae bacterium]